MADLAEAVYSRATTHAGLSALIGTRAYPVRLPPGPTYPALTYFRVAAERHSAHGSDTGVVRATMQISAWAGSYKAARSVADQVRAAFQRFRATAAGVEILDSLLEAEIDLYEEEAQVHQVAQDFDIFYRES